MAAALFDRTTKVGVKEMMKSSFWENKEYDKYNIPDIPNEPSGKGAFAKFEDADNGDLYNQEARICAFRIRTKNRFLTWLKVFAFRYHGQIGDYSDHTVNWLDKVQHDDGPIVEIFIQIIKGSSEAEIKKDSNKILTFHLYPTTFLITIQGNHHKYWSDHEFKYLKSMVDEACGSKSGENKLSDTELNETICSQFETVLDFSETDLKATSSPKPIKTDKPKLETVVDQSIISSVHAIEEKLCHLSINLDKHMESMNEKMKKIDTFDTIIKSNKSDLDQKISILEEKINQKLPKNSNEDILSIKVKDIDQKYEHQSDKISILESNLQGLSDST